MKQQQLSGYKPNYPKKMKKGVTLAAAALLALGAMTGCRAEVQTTGLVPMDEPGIEETVPPGEVQTEGMVPVEEPLMTPGAPLAEPTPEPTGTDELELMGDVAILDDMP